jgi:hypothetical protein
MTEEIVFDPIDFEDAAQQAAKYQVTTTCKLMKGGKKVYIKEETAWFKEKWPSYMAKKFFEDHERKSLKIPITDSQPASIALESRVGEYGGALNEQKEKVFGNFHPLYVVIPNIKEPEPDEENPDRVLTKKFTLDLDFKYNNYYEGEQLDEDNSKIVTKTFLDNLKNKDVKDYLNNVSVTLKFMEDGKEVKKTIKFTDIERKNEISTKVHFRKIANKEKITDELATELFDSLMSMTEEEQREKYGMPELMEVKTPSDMDKYYKRNCFVRFIYAPRKVWATKNKDQKINGKMMRRCGIKFICKEIDILQIEDPYDSYDPSVKNKYTYGFTGKAAVPQVGGDDDEDDDEDDEDDKEPPVPKGPSLKNFESDDDDDEDDAPAKESKPVKATKNTKNVKVESEDDDDDDDDDDEPKPVKSNKSKKAVIEKEVVETKPSKSTKKTK